MIFSKPCSTYQVFISIFNTIHTYKIYMINYKFDGNVDKYNKDNGLLGRTILAQTKQH